MAHETMSGERGNHKCGGRLVIPRLCLARGGEVVNWSGSGGKERRGQAAKGLRRDSHRRLGMDHVHELTSTLPWSSPCSATDDLSDAGWVNSDARKCFMDHWQYSGIHVFSLPHKISFSPHLLTFTRLTCFSFTSVGLMENSWNMKLAWLKWQNVKLSL